MRRLAILALVLSSVLAGCDVTAVKMLFGTGAGRFAPLYPPTDASWARPGGTAGLLLSPTEAWHETAIYEPNVLFLGGKYRMWFGAGWANSGVGYAECPGGKDPTVTANWTLHVGPVYGQGGSGWAGKAGNVLVQPAEDGTLWLFATNNDAPAVRIATSTDGIAWTTQMSSITLPSGKTLWGNREVWLEGSTYYMLQEAGPSTWSIYLYTSTDKLNWTIANGGNPLSSLQVHAGGMYGGPGFATNGQGHSIPKWGGFYHLWLHAANVSGNLPTDVYHATLPEANWPGSPNTWTISPAGPVMTHAGSGWEVDQLADPSIVVAGGMSYLFVDGEDNGASAGHIGVAAAPATP